MTNVTVSALRRLSTACDPAVDLWLGCGVADYFLRDSWSTSTTGSSL